MASVLRSVGQRLTATDGVYKIATTVIAVLALSVLFWPRRRPRRAPGVPIVKRAGESIKAARERFRHDARNMLLEGYGKFKDQPFYVPTPLGERLQIPARYVDELRAGSIEELDFPGTFFEMFEGKYTTMGDRSQLHPYVTRVNLTANIPNILSDLQDEIEDCFNTIFGLVGSEWTRISLPEPMTSAVARISSRMFGGLTLSRNERWNTTVVAFAHDGFIGAQCLKKFPRAMHPFVAPFISALRRIRLHHETTRQIICPMIHARREKPETAGYRIKEVDALRWMMDEARGDETRPDAIAALMLKLSFASIHTSAAAPVQAIYDLCAYPEYIEPLRKEIQAALAEEGSFNRSALARLVRLDSFMTESQRFNPLLLVTYERILTREYALSDGFTIPKGTQIGCPCQAVGMDPALIPGGGNPEEFDGFRYSNLREAGVPDAGKYVWNASNLGAGAMAFGYGRHACPGRHFAAVEIKLLLAYVLLNFDFEFADGRTERPKSLGIETQNLPDPSVIIAMRRR